MALSDGIVLAMATPHFEIKLCVPGGKSSRHVVQLPLELVICADCPGCLELAAAAALPAPVEAQPQALLPPPPALRDNTSDIFVEDAGDTSDIMGKTPDSKDKKNGKTPDNTGTTPDIKGAKPGSKRIDSEWSYPLGKKVKLHGAPAAQAASNNPGAGVETVGLGGVVKQCPPLLDEMQWRLHAAGPCYCRPWRRDCGRCMLQRKAKTESVSTAEDCQPRDEPPVSPPVATQEASPTLVLSDTEEFPDNQLGDPQYSLHGA